MRLTAVSKRTRDSEERSLVGQQSEVVANGTGYETGCLRRVSVALEEQHSLAISMLKESYEVEIGKLQSELNEVKAKYDALKEGMTGCGKSAELGGEVNEVTDKVAELGQKMKAETTRQTELVAFGNRLARKEQGLVAQSEGLKAELERIKGEWVKLEREQSRRDFQVLRYTDWQRAIDTAKYDREVAIEDAIDLRYKWARENERANELKMKLASYSACCDTEHCIETFLDEMLTEANNTVDAVINFNVPDEVLVERISGHRVHSASGRSYHVKFAPPKVAGKDDMTDEPSSKQFRLRRGRCVTSTG
ncbi:hypothetical protein PR001_g16724 [Phytophthora rubi]|uniref:Adenylate kinase active site lid domain-containing protein n=1 Tax=Phytophthora rubi TaxID=129364 RepID=A0A6A3KMW2_9STRA|nr:hypothetical protein PR001_g16724 [Phytophthora rubi]